MIAYCELPPEVELLDKEASSVGEALLKLIASVGKEMKIDRSTDLLTRVNDGWVYIDNGILKYFHRNRLVRLYRTGDLLSISSLDSRTECRCVSEFSVTARLFETKELALALAGNPDAIFLLLRCAALQSTIMHMLCAAFGNDDIHPDLEIRTFEPGAIIIAENTPALEIFQMIQGTAVVTVNTTQVGVVEAGEVFGEVSFFTESVRSATVTAKTTCMVQVMRDGDFVTLAKLKPSVNLAISKTLSKRLVNTNRKIIENP